MTAPSISSADEPTVSDEVALAVAMAETLRALVHDAQSFKSDCADVSNLADIILDRLRALVRILPSPSQPFYDRPTRRVLCETKKNLLRALRLAHKCRRRTLFTRMVSIIGQADFRKVTTHLEASIGDLNWLQNILDGNAVMLSLPPIAINDPTLAWVWSAITSITIGPLGERVDAANQLASLAQGSERNKKFIVDEGGVPPLLNLLKLTPDAKIAAANALYHLDQVGVIANEGGVPIIVQCLANSPTNVQSHIAKLISKIAETNPVAQGSFGKENAVRPLIALLDGDQNSRSLREKTEAKENASEALYNLARGSVENCRRIAEGKGMLCLAKLAEEDEEKLGFTCLMTLTEIAEAGERNADLRRTAFKTNSLAAKSTVSLLLRIVERSESSASLMAASKAIGSLARTFPARETGIIKPLVNLVSHRGVEVATEAAVALGKFVCPENFLSESHAKTMIEFKGIPPLMRLVRGAEKAQAVGVAVLCHLAMHADNEALEQSRVLQALEGVDRQLLQTNHELRDLVSKAVHHINLFHASSHSQRFPFVRM